MLQPLTHTWTNPRTRPIGVGFNPRVHDDGQRIHRPRTNPIGTGLHGLGDSSNNSDSGFNTTVKAIAGTESIISAGLAIFGIINNLFKGCGTTCTQATSIANQVAGLLQQNLNNYLNQTGPHYASVQAYYLSIFDKTWAQLMQACGNPQLAAAGQRCISDRQQGACTWKASPGGWTQDSTGKWSYQGYGAAGSGDACWNWFTGYRDPIANDPTVVPDPQAVINTDGSTTVSTVNPQTGAVTTSTTPPSMTTQLSTALNSLTYSIPAPLLLGGAALALLMILGGD